MDDDEECDDSSDSPESEIMDANQLQVSDFFQSSIFQPIWSKEQKIDEVPKDTEDDLKDTVTNGFFTCISTLKYKEKLMQQLVGTYLFHIGCGFWHETMINCRKELRIQTDS